MRKGVVALTIFLMTISFSAVVQAGVFSISLDDYGDVGNTRIFRADLTAIAGLDPISSIKITDDGTPFGGASGIFSGFDLDALFLDVDGNLATPLDRYFATGYGFVSGSIRPTTSVAMQSTTAHPGPTFGSLDANTVDRATANLETFDGVSIADVTVADGFLTLGDGGMLLASFFPEIPVSPSLFLFLGEVGGQCGEFAKATVEVNTNPVSEPTPLLLLGLGLIMLSGYGRKKLKT